MEKLEAFVPPLAIGVMPVRPLAAFTCAQAGLLDVPVLERYLVAVAFFANLAYVFAAEA